MLFIGRHTVIGKKGPRAPDFNAGTAKAYSLTLVSASGLAFAFTWTFGAALALGAAFALGAAALALGLADPAASSVVPSAFSGASTANSSFWLLASICTRPCPSIQA